MKRLVRLIALAAVVVAMPVLAADRRQQSLNNFASDFQTVPVMGNTPGANNSSFQTYVAVFNPTATAYPIEVTLYDPTGKKATAQINLAAGELRTYPNFLDAVFHYAGGGAVTFKSPDPSNRFVVSAEVWTAGGGRYGTTLPVLEFAGSSFRSFSPGVTVSSTARTNIGCFNQSGAANNIRATVYDSSGHQTLGTVDLNLAPNAWGQTAVPPIVTDGYIQFDPTEAAVCYAVVVSNTTNDGNVIPAVEYRP